MAANGRRLDCASGQPARSKGQRRRPRLPPRERQSPPPRAWLPRGKRAEKLGVGSANRVCAPAARRRSRRFARSAASAQPQTARAPAALSAVQSLRPPRSPVGGQTSERTHPGHSRTLKPKFALALALKHMHCKLSTERERSRRREKSSLANFWQAKFARFERHILANAEFPLQREEG